MSLDNFTRDDGLLGGVALLLAIDLLFLPWFSITVFGLHFTTTATGSLDGWTAVLAGLACFLIIADVLVERPSPGTALPNLGWRPRADALGVRPGPRRLRRAEVRVAHPLRRLRVCVLCRDRALRGARRGRPSRQGGGRPVVNRLRTGEWLAAVGGVVSLVALFMLHWSWRTSLVGWWSYPPLSEKLGGPNLLATGWQALPTLRWFVLVTAVLGLAIAAAQAASRGPALPVTLDLIAMLVAGVTTILVAIRLATAGLPLRFGAVVGVFAVALVTTGAYQAMRAEQGWTPGDPEHPIELVELGPADAA